MLYAGDGRCALAAERTGTSARHDGGARLVEAPSNAGVAAAPIGIARGTIIVRNHTSAVVDVYLKRDDGQGFTTSDFVNTVPPGYRLRIRGVLRGPSVLAATISGDSSISWGPRSFRLRRRYIWTLLP